MGAHIENTPKRNLNVWPAIILRSFKLRLWNCESSMPMHCSAICYAVERTLKIAHKLCPTFQLIEVFQCIDSGLFFLYKLHNLKNNEMSLFRIHGSGKRTAQQRRFNWIGCILHVLPDVFMLEGLCVSFTVDDQIGVYFPAISHCYVWCYFTCVIWEMYKFCSLYLQACMFYILVYIFWNIFLKVNGKNNPHAWSTVLFWLNEYIEWRIATWFPILS